ncbi:MAG TPA: hypothetical protein VIW80_19815 [Pyrinomonadaceae bacterium]
MKDLKRMLLAAMMLGIFSASAFADGQREKPPPPPKEKPPVVVTTPKPPPNNNGGQGEKKGDKKGRP